MRGDGRIFLRGENYWMAFFVDGVEYREACKDAQGNHVRDAKLAQKCLRARIKEKNAHEIGARKFTPPTTNRLTVRELLDALKADFQLRGVLSNQTSSHLARALADFGEYRATQLTAEEVDRYIEKRIADKDAPATINRTTQLLSQALRLAAKRGHLSYIPHVRKLSEAGNARSGFLTEKEVQAVIQNLPADIQDFVRFGFIAGMRKNEICSLTWSDVDGDALVLRGENSKNGEARIIPIVGELASLLERRRKARLVNGVLTNYIFHRDGERVGEFRKSWKTACKRAGVVGKIFHDLRRSAVRNMTQAGIPQNVAMKISGHKTDAMFRRYNIVATDDLRAALEKTELYRAASAK